MMKEMAQYEEEGDSGEEMAKKMAAKKM